MRILYEEGDRTTWEPGQLWLVMADARGNDQFDGGFPIYILRWRINGYKDNKSKPTVASSGLELLPQSVETNAQAIRYAIAKYDELKNQTENR